MDLKIDSYGSEHQCLTINISLKIFEEVIRTGFSIFEYKKKVLTTVEGPINKLQ